MKKYYKISEISKLYNIGVDSLRYYEKLGILKPRRDANGYRLYNLKDIYKLNIIRDLRRLDFSMMQIKEYLDQQSVQNTLELLHQEEKWLHGQIQELRSREKIIRSRIATLNTALEIPTGIITQKTVPERLCVRLNEQITRDEEMDFVIQKLHQIHENKIQDFGNQPIGAVLSAEDLKQGHTNIYTSVFFILEQEAADYDFVLPAGEYLSCFYRGEYEQNAGQFQRLLAYTEGQHLQIIGDPFELYMVDNRDTIQPEEFLTEIQVQVKQTLG